MRVNIIHVGLDVDNSQYHGSAFNKDSGEVIDFKRRPTFGLPVQLNKVARPFEGCAIKICYEASYVGYSLQRDLTEHDYHCDVVAPRQRGGSRQTASMRVNWQVTYYANDLLTIVEPPKWPRR